MSKPMKREYAERIKPLVDESGMSQKQFAQAIGASERDVSHWNRDGYGTFDRYWHEIADLFHVSVAYLKMETDEKEPDHPTENKLSETVMRVVNTYEENEDFRRLLDALLPLYAKKPEPKRETKIIPLFGAFAAGPGEPDYDMMMETYEVDSDEKADFAIKISGDSMEPYLHDGQIALGQHKRPEIGDIAAVFVNGDRLVKQWVRDNYGNLYLLSLNRKREDLDRTVWASGDERVECIGVINMGKKIPIPI